MKIQKNGNSETVTMTVDQSELANMMTAFTMTLCSGSRALSMLLGLAVTSADTKTVRSMLDDVVKLKPHLKELANIYAEIKENGIYSPMPLTPDTTMPPTFIAPKRESFPPNLPPPSTQN